MHFASRLKNIKHIKTLITNKSTLNLEHAQDPTTPQPSPQWGNYPLIMIITRLINK